MEEHRLPQLRGNEEIAASNTKCDLRNKGPTETSSSENSGLIIKRKQIVLIAKLTERTFEFLKTVLKVNSGKRLNREGTGMNSVLIHSSFSRGDGEISQPP